MGVDRYSFPFLGRRVHLLLPPISFPPSLTVFADHSGLNVFFNFHQPAPLIIPIVLLLVAHPLGKFLSYSLSTSPSAYALQEVSGPHFLSMS